MFNKGFEKLAESAAAKIKAIGNQVKKVKTPAVKQIPLRPAGVNLTDWYEKHLPRLMKEQG